MFGKGKRVEKVQLVTNDGTAVDEPGKESPAPAETKPQETPAEPPPAEPSPKEAAAKGETAERRAEKKPERTRMAKPKTNQKPRKPASEEAVLSRARRLANKELRKVAAALGMEKYDEEELNQRLDEMVKAREDNQSALERLDGRAKTLEEQNAELRAKISQLNKDLTDSRREAENAKGELEEYKVVHEIAEAAMRVGVTDTDYAVELFRRHASKLGDNEEPDVNAFFEGLKNDPKRRYLFKEEEVTAGPKPAGETPQQPAQPAQPQQPQGQQGATQGQNSIPDQGAPAPANPGAQPEGKDALDMNPREFAEHTAKNYGFRPGRA